MILIGQQLWVVLLFYFLCYAYPRIYSQKKTDQTFVLFFLNMGLRGCFYILNECLPLCVHQSSIFLLFLTCSLLTYFSSIIHYFNYFQNDLFNYYAKPFWKFYEIFNIQLAYILLIIFSINTAISLF